jgi:hypothetical protein
MADLKRSVMGLAYGSERFTNYNGDEAGESTAGPGCRERVPPLDAILSFLVGGLQVLTLLAFLDPGAIIRRSATRVVQPGTRWCVLLTIMLLLDPTDSVALAPEWTLPFRRNEVAIPNRIIGRRYAGHIAQLRAGPAPGKPGGPLLRVVQWGTSWFISGYFAVMKTASCARSIFNGKLLSRLCPTPMPVNLTDTQGLVRAVVDFLRRQRPGRRRMFVVGGDFRHWFHQIPGVAWMQRLFGLRDADGNEYQWQSIPMGWSWSPLIAQACAWAVLAFHESEEHPLLDPSAFAQGRLPTWVNVLGPDGKTVVGVATVYYDNYLFLVDNKTAYEYVLKRVARNTAHLQAEVKEGSTFSFTTDDLVGPEGGFTYLGMTFKAERDPTGRQDKPAAIGKLTWGPSKLDSWKSRFDPSVRPAAHVFTCRSMAQLSGQCLFALLMAPGGLRRHDMARPLIEVTKTVGRMAHTAEEKWNATWTDEACLRQLWEVWLEVVKLEKDPYECDFSQPLPRELAPAAYTHVLFTDASKDGLGWSWMHQNGEQDWVDDHGESCRGRPLTPVEAEEHIFFLELRAAIEGLQAWIRCHPSDLQRVTLVVDNAAAAFALRHGFSSNAKATALICSARASFERVEDIVLVISGDNPADCCSRNRPQWWQRGQPDPTSHSIPLGGQGREWDVRLTRAQHCIHSRARGWNWASETRTAWHDRAGQQAGLRHNAPEDSGVVATDSAMDIEDDDWQI